MELGNHTLSHPKFYDSTLEAFKQEVLRGERVTKTLFTPKNGTARFFRHPYLNTGPTMAVRKEFEDFLTKHNYRIAPVTVDSAEWIYAAAYKKAIQAGDAQLSARIGEDYLSYMIRQFAFFEQLSQDLFQREIAQVLMLHANQLNADYIDQLLLQISARGYSFVSLSEALIDPAYTHEDTYIGSSGLSWLQRWWFTEGNDLRPEPSASQWVKRIAF